jgi:hypothetical protein
LRGLRVNREEQPVARAIGEPGLTDDLLSRVGPSGELVGNPKRSECRIEGARRS